MKSYPSRTVNGGQTIILESLPEACEKVRSDVAIRLKTLSSLPPSSFMPVYSRPRDDEETTIVMEVGEYVEGLKKRLSNFENCVKRISSGRYPLSDQVVECTENLADLVSEIEPRLRGSYLGWERGEEGTVAIADLLESGDDRPFFRQRSCAEVAGLKGRAEGYRLVLSTDTSWFGEPEDNAAVICALVLCLQRFGPVELWIQQGWVGADCNDGVTLFKIEQSSSAFDPTELLFWCMDEGKDSIFSFELNCALGRRSSKTTNFPEIPADLFLRGDWMKIYGVREDFAKRLHTEKLDIMARWIAATVIQILSQESGLDQDGMMPD